MSNHIIQKVTGVKTGFSNSALRMPYALIQLACGHVGDSVATIGCLLECLACGEQFRGLNSLANCNNITNCKCGNGSGVGNNGPGLRIVALPNPHKAEDRLTMPVACRCKECETEEAEFAEIPALVAKSVHSRFREWGGGIITFYGQEATSPTGVRAIASIRATPRAEQEIRRCNSSISPLSPTEGLMRGR